MSAWIVSKDHIDLLVTAALAWEQAVPEQADHIGQMLWRENLESITYCYPDDPDGVVTAILIETVITALRRIITRA